MVSIFDGLFPFLTTMILVVVIIYLSFLVSRFMAGNADRLSRAKYIQLIDRLPLGQEKMVAVVKVSNRYFLIGITGEAINLLEELNPEDIVNDPPDENGTDGLAKSFKDVLSKSLLRGGKK